MIMLGAAFDNGWGMRTPRELSGVNQGVYLIVDDIEAHYEREFRSRDPEGNIWSFGTYRPE